MNAITSVKINESEAKHLQALYENSVKGTVLLMVEALEGATLSYDEKNLWAFAEIADHRAETIAAQIKMLKEAHDEIAELRQMILDQQDRLTESARLLKSMGPQKSVITSADTSAGAPKLLVVPGDQSWYPKTSNVSGPFRAHQTTDGWCVVDRDGNNVIIDRKTQLPAYVTMEEANALVIDWNH